MKIKHKSNGLNYNQRCLPHPPSPSTLCGEGEKGGEVIWSRFFRFYLRLLLFCFVLFMNLPLLANDGLDTLDEIQIDENVSLKGNRYFENKKILSEMNFKHRFNVDWLEANIDKILTLYDDNGFPYCQVSPDNFKISEKGGLSFSLAVEEGPRVTIKEIQLEGLKTAKRKVILRELGSDLFGFFSSSRLDRSLKRVKRLSYIKDVAEPELLAGGGPEEGKLRITLVERRNNTFSGSLGYAPSSGNRKGNLMGSMELVFDNIFGTGRKAEWSWFRKDPFSSRFFFLYQEPWILGLPLNVEFKISQLDYDSTFLQLSFETKLIFNSTDKMAWGVEGGWEKVVPGSAGKSFLSSSRKYRMGIILSLDLLDQVDNPRKGLFYQMETGYAQKRNYPTTLFFPEKPMTYLINTSWDLNNFIPTLSKQTFLVGLHLKALHTDENVIPLSDQYKLGGINTIRGYREDEFFGTTLAWTNLEYRFLLDETSRFFLFTDYGYYERKASSLLGNTHRNISGNKLGYGFGMRIDSKAGLLGIDYGLGEGDSFSQGKIHFGVVNRF